MSGNKYNRYYKPMAGHLLVLPFPDKPASTLLTARLDEIGNMIDVDQAIYSGELSKGVVVEKGRENPNYGSQVKRRDIVLFKRGSGKTIRIKTETDDCGPIEREFVVLNEHQDVLGVM